MGGGPRIQYPTAVYTPVGGWYSNPKNAKRNTFIAIGIALAAAIPVFKIMTNFERRPSPGIFAIPSQSWSKFARVDDPNYDAKLAKKNKKESHHKEHHHQHAVVAEHKTEQTTVHHKSSVAESKPVVAQQQQAIAPQDWTLNNLLKQMPDNDDARRQFLQKVQDKKL